MDFSVPGPANLVSAERIQQFLVYRLLEAWYETRGAVDSLRRNDNPELAKALEEVSQALGLELRGDATLIANALIRALSRTIADVVNGTGPVYLPGSPLPGMPKQP
jgi:hypothetical protein